MYICVSRYVLDDVDLEPKDLTHCLEEAGLNESIRRHYSCAHTKNVVKGGRMKLSWFGGGSRERDSYSTIYFMIVQQLLHQHIHGKLSVSDATGKILTPK